MPQSRDNIDTRVSKAHLKLRLPKTFSRYWESNEEGAGKTHLRNHFRELIMDGTTKSTTW